MFGITAAALVKWSYILSLVAASIFVVAIAIFRAAMTAYTIPLLVLLVATLIAFIALVMVLAGLVFGQFSSLNMMRALISNYCRLWHKFISHFSPYHLTTQYDTHSTITNNNTCI